jgi:branched-subunit amino acid aminotransferase/4-amino-4-deoxychorismate lyase
MKFLIINSEMAQIEEISLNHLLTESSFRLAQQVWYGYGGIPLFRENLISLQEQAEVLRLPFPKALEDHREMFRITKRMLNKNRFYRSGYVHIQLFYKEGEVHTLITCNALREFTFPFSGSGLLAVFSQHKKQSGNRLNRFPFFSEMLWRAGLAEIHESQCQQAIFLNENNLLCEGVQANLFLVKADQLITPALTSGCYEDVLRPVILSAAKEAGLRMSERSRTEKMEIFETDEVFTASESRGIEWILGVENKRFLHRASKIIHDKVSNRLQEKVTR